jgi:hypothetical protein
MAVWLLWKTRLSASVPVVSGVAIVTSALVGPLSLFGVPVVFAATILSMVWCRRRFAWNHTSAY